MKTRCNFSKINFRFTLINQATDLVLTKPYCRMKKNYLKIFNKRLLFIGAVLLTVALIINSCRKDSKVIISKPTITVADAKAWYESTYSVATLSGARNFRVLNSSTASTTDFTKLINPDRGPCSPLYPAG